MAKKNQLTPLINNRYIYILDLTWLFLQVTGDAFIWEPIEKQIIQALSLPILLCFSDNQYILSPIIMEDNFAECLYLAVCERIS